MLDPQGMVDEAVQQKFPAMAWSEAQPMGGGLYSARVATGPEQAGELGVHALAFFEIRAVMVGEPVLLSVAGSQV